MADDEDDLRLTDLPHSAGGFGAMVATARHLGREGLRRGSRALLALNQPEGFDCPGCAWPEPTAKHRAKLEFCENGAKAIAEETTEARCTPDVLGRATVDELRALSDFELGQLGRLTHPMLLDEGRTYRPISWERAIAICAEELAAGGPDRSIYYTSGRTSNEAAFLYQLVGRLQGTNNFPDCSNMCHESSGVALSDSIGSGKGTVSLEDFAHCDLIFIVGQNPGTNHPRMLTTLREAAKRGCKIVAVNPLREVGLSRFAHPQKPLDMLTGGVPLTTHHVQLPIGCDQAFFLALGRHVLDHERAVSAATDVATVVESRAIDGRSSAATGSAAGGQRGWIDGRGSAATGSAAEGQRGWIDGRSSAATGSAAEGQRGWIDGRSSAATGGAAEGQRGWIDGRSSAATGSAAEGQRGWIDGLFIGDYTDGFADWRAHALAFSWDELVARAGVPEAQIREIGDLYLASKATIACWAMGLTQHKHAVATIQEVVNLMLLRGNVGRPGAGLCPVRGHSNVQGDRTMGIYHLPRPAFLDALGAEFGFMPPHRPGVDVVKGIHQMEDGDCGAFIALGGNWISATPDTERTMRAMESCALTASISTKLNRTHLYPGKRALILPCLGRSEQDGGQFVTVEDSMSMVHRSQGVLPPASPELRSEPWIVAQLGAALFPAKADWARLAHDYDAIRDHVARVVPGFEDFNARVRTPDGFQLPNAARDREFSRGRAKFTIETPPDLTLPPGRLRMMTIRSHDQYNTTIYGLDDRYRGIQGGRRVLFIHGADLAERGLVEREVVDLISEWDDGERVAEAFVCVPYDLPRGNCATYFPEANALVPLDSIADKSHTPTSKSVVIRIRSRSAP